MKVSIVENISDSDEGGSTALLLFARTAEGEVRHKTFLKRGSSGQELVVASALLTKTRQTCLHSHLPVFVYPDYRQTGSTFGERLANAIEDVFSRGYGKVITIGSDTPSLNHNHIRKARELLSTTDMVFGPATDGGVYLIGMSRAAYCRADFLKLPWLSEQVYNAFQTLADHNSLSHASLQTLSDIDSKVDLFYVLKDHKLPERFAKLIYQLIGWKRFHISTDFNPSPLFTPASALLRAPPGQ